MDSWDLSYLKLAEFWADQRSKDPSTKVGAVIVRPDKTIASMGFNGMPRGLSDAVELYENREFKMQTVVHAEINALLTAREALHGCTVYVAGLPPCPNCASALIQAGIKRVVTWYRPIPDRWIDAMRVSISNLLQAGVAVQFMSVTGALLCAKFCVKDGALDIGIYDGPHSLVGSI